MGRLALEELLELEAGLDDQLSMGVISDAEYDVEHAELLHAAGWTRDEYELAIDQRWDRIDAIRASVPPGSRRMIN